MPLATPYVSPLVHKEIVKPDPATLPTAGRIDNPPNHDPMAYHIKRAKVDHTLHVGHPGLSFTAQSLAKTSYQKFEDVKRPIPRRDQLAQKPTKFLDGQIGGLGKSVSGINDTSDWTSLKRSTIDASAVGGQSHLPPLDSTIERRRKSWETEKDKVLTKSWASETRGTKAHENDCFEAAKQILAERHARDASRRAKNTGANTRIY
jgi:hypothetical protein